MDENTETSLADIIKKSFEEQNQRIEQKFTEQKKYMDERFKAQDKYIEQKFAENEKRLDNMEKQIGFLLSPNFSAISQ